MEIHLIRDIDSIDFTNSINFTNSTRLGIYAETV